MYDQRHHGASDKPEWVSAGAGGGGGAGVRAHERRSAAASRVAQGYRPAAGGVEDSGGNRRGSRASGSAVLEERGLPALHHTGRKALLRAAPHGGRPPARLAQGYHVARLAADLRDLLDGLGLSQVTAVGTSMGAAGAWWWWSSSSWC